RLCHGNGPWRGRWRTRPLGGAGTVRPDAGALYGQVYRGRNGRPSTRSWRKGRSAHRHRGQCRPRRQPQLFRHARRRGAGCRRFSRWPGGDPDWSRHCLRRLVRNSGRRPEQFQGSVTHMEILTGNELVSGAAVYLRADGVWGEDLQASRLFGKDDVEGRDAAIAASKATGRIVGVEIEEIDQVDGVIVPRRLRERIRAAGPTAPLTLNGQAYDRQHLDQDGHVSI